MEDDLLVSGDVVVLEILCAAPVHPFSQALLCSEAAPGDSE